jgi:hypothetical protein
MVTDQERLNQEGSHLVQMIAAERLRSTCY